MEKIMDTEKLIKRTIVLIKYSSINPNFSIEDIPVNYLHITYELLKKVEHTELATTVENFNNDRNRIINIAKGRDNVVLPALEKLFNKP
jgi:hypothetical protein